ncbi:dihydropteroate synthase [Micromonospora yasonensis]|uniref:dihydropteroate synthase n=1 Tax=Micromonospora yasonensis TaxID=1128667 RepID=UPI0022306B97|nr:dihydropteroate synthase [Micromonospora yasonensis]MCW3841180.1 dihydropteroate synthase [Micromonospora yasonensis]
MRLRMGGQEYDLTHRALVMGILNRTRDSFYDAGRHYDLDALLCRAAELVAGGADVLDVGARAGGVGVREVTVEQERDLVVETVVALRERFDVPVSVDTRHGAVAAAAFAAGAALGNDMSGFRDPDYLPAVAAADAAAVATHIRLPPGVPDPDPVYHNVVTDVRTALAGLVDRALRAGVHPDSVIVDPGLDLGKTWQQSVELLAGTDRFTTLGRPVLVAASHKIFLGRLLGLDKDERAPATVAACALGVHLGARVVRVHDAAGARQAVDLATALVRASA